MVLEPTNEAELADAIAGAAGPLRVRGGGTRPIGAPGEGEVLSVAGLSGISLYEPGALTLVAAAGTPVAEIEAALEAEGQMLPFEPMDHRKLMGTEGAPTIGGVVAANVSGPRRVKVGACRDSLIGVRFVDGEGRRVKNGGRVMKNVTGYDLVKLMAGAYGTLGVLSEVSFKVLPKNGAQATLVADGQSPTEAVAAMSAALGSPFEVSGAAYHAGAGKTWLRIEGLEASVTYRFEQLVETLARHGTWTQADDADLWTSIRDVEMLADAPGDVWRVSLKGTDAPEALSRVAPEDALLDWGGGLVWLRVAEGTDVRARLGGIAGHATLIRASEATRAALPVFEPEPAPLKALAEGLRRQLDPKGILNPGLMG